MALLISIRKPRFTCTSPRSSIHGTRNMITRSGSEIRSRSFAERYSGWRSSTGTNESNTSWVAWWNSGSAGFLARICTRTCWTYSFTLGVLVGLFTETSRALMPDLLGGLGRPESSVSRRVYLGRPGGSIPVLGAPRRRSWRRRPPLGETAGTGYTQGPYPKFQSHPI